MNASRPHILMAVAALMGAAAVMAGAMAAHWLQPQLSVSQLATFDTATRYLMYHALALLALSAALLNTGQTTAAAMLQVGWLWVAGSLAFSGSLYLLVLMQLGWVVWLTPVGGLLLLIGWLRLAWLALKSACSKRP